MLLFLAFLVVLKVEVNAAQKISFSTKIEKINLTYENVKIEKYNSDVDNIRQIAFNLNSKMLFKYKEVNSILNDTSEAVEVAKMYYYKNNVFHNDSLTTYSKDKEAIETEIIDFYEERINYANELNENETSELFQYVTSGHKRIVKKPYGYMDHSYTVKKYRASDISSLYIVETNSDFVPGIVAYLNGDSSYGYNIHTMYGYMHLNATQAVDEIDQSTKYYGGIPCFKDAWPVNVPGKISINSSYNYGVSYGYSFKNGFSLDNFSLEYDDSKGQNIEYSYSKTYTTDEPRLTAQHDSNDYNKYQWTLIYNDPNNGCETSHLSTGYMFEMNNSGHEMVGEGQFGLHYDFLMNVGKKNVFQNSKTGGYDIVFTNKTSITGYLYVNWW